MKQKNSIIQQQNLRTTDLPAVYVYYDGDYYPIKADSYSEHKKVIHLMNRLLHPLVNLKSQEQIEEFLNVKKEHEEKTKFMMPTGITLRKELYLNKLYSEQTFKTRVIILIYNKGDYDGEI